MPTKKIIIALLIIVVAVGGFVAGLYLLQERQDLQEKAAVVGGKATVNIDPSSGNYNVGDTIVAKITFDTANIAVSGVAVRLSYPYSGSSPEITPDININSAISGSGDWTCPTKSWNQQSQNVIIDIACANTSAAGFTASNTELATVELKVNRKPEISPLTVRFDNALSIITQKSDGRDILLIPSSTGSYTIAGAAVTTTAAPTLATTATPTSKVSGTPTPTKKVTSTPTVTPAGGAEELPEAGISYPTILGIGTGVLVIIGAVILAL